MKVVAVVVCDFAQNMHGLLSHFRADTVARQDYDSQLHDPPLRERVSEARPSGRGTLPLLMRGLLTLMRLPNAPNLPRPQRSVLPAPQSARSDPDHRFASCDPRLR